MGKTQTKSQAKMIQELSKRVKIPAYEFKEALGLLPRPCKARTLEQARRIHARAGDYTEKKVAALKRWDELSLKRVNKAVTISEVELELNYYIPAGGKAKAAAVKKHNELLIVEVAKAKTLKEAERYYDDYLVGSEVRVAALRRMWEIHTKRK